MPSRFPTLVILGLLCAGCHDLSAFAPCSVGEVALEGTCTAIPSCQALDGGLPLAETCGPGESCCTVDAVTGGKLQPNVDFGGPTQDGTPLTNYDPTPMTVVVSSFNIDRYEVTVGRFKRFLNAYSPSWLLNSLLDGMGRDPAKAKTSHACEEDPSLDTNGAWQVAWNTEFLPPTRDALESAILDECSIENDPSMIVSAAGTLDLENDDNDNLPITCITWFEAYAFCIWDGGRLPTEAEWNYAAAAGQQERPFPWCAPPDCPDTKSLRPGFALIAAGGNAPDPVGSFPSGASLFGAQDMAGNVAEWVMDAPVVASDYSYDNETTDPLNVCGYAPPPATRTTRVTRSGSFERAAGDARTSVRHNTSPTFRFRDLGARCARPAATDF